MNEREESPACDCVQRQTRMRSKRGRPRIFDDDAEEESTFENGFEDDEEDEEGKEEETYKLLMKKRDPRKEHKYNTFRKYFVDFY